MTIYFTLWVFLQLIFNDACGPKSGDSTSSKKEPVVTPPVTPPADGPVPGIVDEAGGFFVTFTGDSKKLFSIHKGISTFEEP